MSLHVLLTFIMSNLGMFVWCAAAIAVVFMHFISECLSVMTSLCSTVRINGFLL